MKQSYRCSKSPFEVLLLLSFFAFMPFGGQAQQMAFASDQDNAPEYIELCKEEACKIDLLNEKAWKAKNKDGKAALLLLEESERKVRQIDYPKGLANSLHTQGVIYWYRSEYERAARLFFEALKIRIEIQDEIGLARSYNNIGNIYKSQGQYKKAVENYNKGLQIRRKLNDSLELAYSINSVGEVSFLEGNYFEAKGHYYNALDIVEKLGAKSAISFFKANLAELLLQTKEYEAALENLNYSLAFAKIDSNYFNQARDLVLKAKCLSAMNQNQDEALALAKQALQISGRIRAREVKLEAVRTLADIYQADENLENALYWIRKAQELDENLKKYRRSRNIALATATHEAEIKLEEQRAQLDRQYYRLYIALIMGIVVALLIGLFFYRIKFLEANRVNDKLKTTNESLNETNRTLESFAYVASHDLKEPLRTIGAFSSLIQKKYGSELREDGNKYLDFIQKSIERMYLLLDDLLEFTKPIPSKKVPIQPQKVVQDVLDSLDMQIAKKQVQIEVKDFPKEIKVFPSTMQQLFQNLISNAIKFNDNPQPKVEISYQAHKNYHKFCVADNGIGIEPKHRNKIFTAFQRLETQKTEGTGIGLAICKKIVDRHNGEIWVESNDQKGSRFCFTLER